MSQVEVIICSVCKKEKILHYDDREVVVSESKCDCVIKNRFKTRNAFDQAMGLLNEKFAPKNQRHSERSKKRI